MGRSPKYATRKSTSEDVALKFEHPTQTGNIPGGWMVSAPD
jgi:hypothetical protein